MVNILELEEEGLRLAEDEDPLDMEGSFQPVGYTHRILRTKRGWLGNKKVYNLVDPTTNKRILIAGASGMGKTRYGLNWIEELVEHRPVLEIEPPNGKMETAFINLHPLNRIPVKVLSYFDIHKEILELDPEHFINYPIPEHGIKIFLDRALGATDFQHDVLEAIRSMPEYDSKNLSQLKDYTSWYLRSQGYATKSASLIIKMGSQINKRVMGEGRLSDQLKKGQITMLTPHFIDPYNERARYLYIIAALGCLHYERPKGIVVRLVEAHDFFSTVYYRRYTILINHILSQIYRLSRALDWIVIVESQMISDFHRAVYSNADINAFFKLKKYDLGTVRQEHNKELADMIKVLRNREMIFINDNAKAAVYRKVKAYSRDNQFILPDLLEGYDDYIKGNHGLFLAWLQHMIPTLIKEAQLPDGKSADLRDYVTGTILEYESGNNTDTYILGNIEKAQHGRLLLLHKLEEERMRWLDQRSELSFEALDISRLKLEEIQAWVEERLP